MNTSRPFWEQPESRRLEFKETFPKGDQLARTVVAFANGAGGKIVFGVKNEPRQIVGIQEDRLFALEERISSLIFDRCAPIIIPEIYIQAVEGKNLLVIEIFPGSQKPYYLKSKGKHKGAYIRVGSSNRLVSHEMLEALERQRKKISFDAMPAYDVSRDGLDLERFKKDYLKATGRKLQKNHLKNMGLFIYEQEQLWPTNAAILLSDSPARKRLFPYAKVECARFKGTDTKVFIDQTTIEGPIHAAVEPCLAFIKKNITLSSEIGEIYREDRWEYPLEAIREAITNAIIHRDYAILGSDIKVAIFDDMLEITSPGLLPDTLPLEELGTGRSEIRNRILAPIFKDLKLIEAWGTGIQRMRIEVANYPEIELVLQEAGHAFQVQLRKKETVGIKIAHPRPKTGDMPRTSTGQVPDKYRTSIKLAPDMLRLLDFCKEERSVKDMMAFLGLRHRETFLKNYLYPLMKNEFVMMTIPDKPKSPKQKYMITTKGHEKLRKSLQKI
ncbi:MAG: putative DNA binding domain-containing protein [Deltaproteobacteria bacterium]|nr:putative DNA binding domain-containing protein [Deltaproteobacteria bacterium]